MLKGLMNTHNAQQHQDISLRRRVAPLRHQHSDDDFNDSDHCAKLNSGPPQTHLMDHNQHRNRRFEPLHVHHLKSLTSEHSTLLQRSWPRRSSRSQHSRSLTTSAMMTFSNKQLISSQQCCLSNKRLTAFNRHQEALNNQKADRLQRELLQ